MSTKVLSKSSCNVNHHRLLTTVFFFHYYSPTTGSLTAVPAGKFLFHHDSLTSLPQMVVPEKLFVLIGYIILYGYTFCSSSAGSRAMQCLTNAFRVANWALVVKLLLGLKSSPVYFLRDW